MPPLTHPINTNILALPERHASVIADADVVVVGGGPAGLGAAVGAAKTGARVILTERYGFLGGNATTALVIPMMSFHTQGPVDRQTRSATLFPTDHGNGENVISGVLSDLLKRLIERNGAIPPSPQTGYVVPFDPEIFKLVAFELLDEAGVQYLLHAFASDVIGRGNVEGVVLETKSGPVVITGKVIVDCTGDGDIAAMSGARFEVGRESDGLLQPLTLMFIMAGFNRADFEGYVRQHPDQWYGVYGLWDLIRKAKSRGELKLHREDILFFGTTHESEVIINSTRIIKKSGIDVWDLTHAEWEGRRQMREIADFLCRFVPGFENAYIAQSGISIGIRETRRILGDYVLTHNDVLEARKFKDVIARGSYPIDFHNPAGKGTLILRLPPGEAYDIPLRCLFPIGVESLIVSGRCLSGTQEAQSSYRVMPICIATGHAAGVCAGIAALSGRLPRALDATEVQAELVRQGANLGISP